MSLHLTFRKIKGTEALKAHVDEKVAKFKKFVTYPMEIHVLLSVEKTLQAVEITLHAEHKDIVAVAKSKDMYESIDLASHKVEAHLKKEREKHKGHKKAHLAVRPKSIRQGSDIADELPHRAKKVAE